MCRWLCSGVVGYCYLEQNCELVFFIWIESNKLKNKLKTEAKNTKI